MKWRKLGLIYAPAGDKWWARQYATIPTVDVLGDVLRVYFASLDENKYGRIGFVDLDAKDPTRILYESQEPVLDVGELGSFDDCGVNASCVIHFGNTVYLYYIGWQRCERVPYMLFTGLAISKNGGEFKRLRVPILDRTMAEPFSRSAPFVMREGETFRMWYWSCWSWSSGHYNNDIQCAHSPDGVHWRDSLLCFAPERDGDYAVGRPWVIKEDGLYKMWYSIRSTLQPYRMGYAESRNGLSWTRKDNEVGLYRSESGWDSEMVEYPCVVDAAGKRYMFYNGNQHGRTGFGCAVLETMDEPEDWWDG